MDSLRILTIVRWICSVLLIAGLTSSPSAVNRAQPPSVSQSTKWVAPVSDLLLPGERDWHGLQGQKSSHGHHAHELVAACAFEHGTNSAKTSTIPPARAGIALAWRPSPV